MTEDGKQPYQREADDFEPREFRLSPTIRAMCYAGAVSMPIVGLCSLVYVYLMPNKNPLPEDWFILIFFLMFGASYGIVSARWRIRVDAEGIHRRRILRWDTWSWEDFRSAKIVPNGGCVDPDKPFHRRNLVFWLLSDADETAIARTVEARWACKPCPVPTNPITCRRGVWRKETATFDRHAIRHSRRGRLSVYSWDDLQRAEIIGGPRCFQDYRKLTLTFPDNTLQFGMNWKKLWRREKPREILALIFASVPEDRITVHDLTKEPQNEEDRKIQFSYFKRRKRLARITSISLVPIAVALSIYLLLVIFNAMLEHPTLPLRAVAALTLKPLSYLSVLTITFVPALIESREKARQMSVLRRGEATGEAPQDADDRRFRKILRVSLAGSILLLFVVLATAAYGWAKFDSAVTQAHADVATLLSDIREKGEPVELADMETWHPEIPEAENAAILYQKAFDALRNLYSPQDSFDLGEFFEDRDTRTQYSPEELSTAEEYLKPRVAAIATLREAAAMEHCRFRLDFSKDYEMEQPHLARLREAVRLFQLSAILKVEQGDIPGALDEMDDALKVAEALSSEPTLLSQLVRIALLNISLEGFEYLYTNAQPDRNQLTRIKTMFPSQVAQDSLARSLTTERYLSFAATDRVQGWMPNEFDKRELLEQLSALIEASKLPYPQALYAADSIAERFEDPDLRFRTSRSMSCIIMPAYSRAVSAAARGVAKMRLFHTATAIERYRIDKGDIPTDLAELSPTYIASTPEDPFNGEALRYKVLEPGYIVYSVGKNRIDDDGTPESDEVGANWDVTFSVHR